MIAPSGDGHRIALFPRLGEAIEREFGRLDGRRRIDRPHSRAQRLAILPGNELRHVANVMNDAKLDVGMRKHGFHGIAQTAQAIPTNNERVVYTPGFQIIEDLEPEAGAFGFFDPKAKHFLPAGNADSQDGIDTFFDHALVCAYGYPQTIDKDDRIDAF
jgi:hypothetical protein